MKNEFTNKYGHVYAEYNGGQSRNGENAVDYVLVQINDVELYAETEPTEGNESLEVLSAEIQRQAEEKGIDLDDYNPIFDDFIA